MPRRRRTPHFETTYLNSLGDGPGEFFRLSAAGVAALTDLAQMLLWETRWYDDQAQLAELPDLAYQLHGEMTVPLHFDDLVPYVDEIEDLLRGLQALQSAGGCCQNTGPVSQTVTSGYDDTNPPATWAGETVADAADYVELLCGAAHAYVDTLKDMADQLNLIVGASAVVVGAIAGLLGLAAGAGAILTISYGAASSVVAGLIAGATALTFGETAADIEAARADIVCAIVHQTGTDLADAVEAALGTDWTLFFQFVDYETAWAVIHEGGYGDVSQPVNRRTDCDCALVQSDIHFSIERGTLISGPSAGTSADPVYYGGEYVFESTKQTSPLRDVIKVIFLRPVSQSARVTLTLSGITSWQQTTFAGTTQEVYLISPPTSYTLTQDAQPVMGTWNQGPDAFYLIGDATPDYDPDHFRVTVKIEPYP